MEHHANLVPWQQLAQRTGAELAWLPLTDDGRLDLDDLDEIVDEPDQGGGLRPSEQHLGHHQPGRRPIAARAGPSEHSIVLDACQSVPHMPFSVQDLDVDFVAFSAHKMLGPSGIGVLWGRRPLLETLPPFLTGGSMIEQVFMDRSTFAPPPQRFEAGTPPISQAVGLHAAVRYLSDLGMPAVEAHEQRLTEYLLGRLDELGGVRVDRSRAPPRTAAVPSASSSTASTRTTSDRSSTTAASPSGSATTAPGRCAVATASRPPPRASFYVYNDTDDLDALVEGIVAAQQFFGVPA